MARLSTRWRSCWSRSRCRSSSSPVMRPAAWTRASRPCRSCRSRCFRTTWPAPWSVCLPVPRLEHSQPPARPPNSLDDLRPPPGSVISAREAILRGTMTDLSEFGLAGLAAGVAASRFSPVDIVEACLARIARLEPQLHAFVTLYEADARRQAEEAARAIRAGNAKGPFHGLPIAIKDLIEIEGKVTTGGSRVWKDRISAHSATLVKKLSDAGMIVLRKTHTVEFDYGAWGTNQYID